MRSMQDESRTHTSGKILAGAALLAVLASPPLLLGIAIFEQSFIGTNYVTALYDLLGIRNGLQALYELLFPYQ